MNPQRPNHAMEQTADRRMTRLKEELRVMKTSDARSRPPSLILFSLGLINLFIIPHSFDSGVPPANWFNP
jgi:hypothetical protein